jgi:hypothetical protein
MDTKTKVRITESIQKLSNIVKANWKKIGGKKLWSNEVAINSLYLHEIYIGDFPMVLICPHIYHTL